MRYYVHSWDYFYLENQASCLFVKKVQPQHAVQMSSILMF